MIYRVFDCQMAHSTEKTRQLNGSTENFVSDVRSEGIGEKSHALPDDKAQILLTALRSMIVSLVPNAVPNPRVGGPEAERLLIALQNYVISIVGGGIHKENQGQVVETRIRLEGADASVPHITKNYADVESDDDKPDRLSPGENSVVKPSIEVAERTDYFSLGNLLEKLRERVFNFLPVRLLCFERPTNSDTLSISLLNQAEMYSFLAKKFAHTYMSTQVDVSTRWAQLMEITRYAILSHTWLRSGPGELSYDDWRNGTFDVTHAGYRKLVHFCRAAVDAHGLCIGWVDTVCIDKSSSSELDESIRSMYKWYQYSFICITHLAETDTVDQVARDPWFTRGWTLQELLAPEVIKFYNRTWQQLTLTKNDKDNDLIQRQITLATTIAKKELSSHDFSVISISRKMQWVARRQVTREEDIAYSLMGLFDISMSIAYGEGARLAFTRLIKEILSNSKDNVLDIFNWGGEYTTRLSSLLPSNPQAYLTRNESLDITPTLTEPLVLTHMGLRVPVLILPITFVMSSIATPYKPKSKYFVGTSTGRPNGIIVQLIQGTVVFDCSCNVLDVSAFNRPAGTTSDRYALAVLNCTGDEIDINIPAQCLAIMIHYSPHFASDVSQPHQ